jgi:methionyl-tRNA formyltransferase
MKVTLIGSRHFGVSVFEMLLSFLRVEVVRVVVHDGEDRLASAARAGGTEVIVQADPRRVSAAEIARDTDLIVTAHSHAKVTREALTVSRFGGIGYHPSLLPRHRGAAAVEWTIKDGDPIAGGTVYRLTDRLDAGGIVLQEWCFVRPGESARELWERALAPMGVRLLRTAVQFAIIGDMPDEPQQEEFATSAP